MDDIYTTELLGLWVFLTELSVKGTATAVSSKIKRIKEEKSDEKIRSTYDEIINELLNEREEIVHNAQTYKSELEKLLLWWIYSAYTRYNFVNSDTTIEYVIVTVYDTKLKGT